MTLPKWVKRVNNICCQSSTYIFHDREHVCIVDPGDNVPQQQYIIDSLDIQNPIVTILATHGHIDHIIGIPDICEKYNVDKIYIGKGDIDYLSNNDYNLANEFGCTFAFNHFEKVQMVKDNDLILIGDYIIRVLECPGHSPGSLFFVCDDQEVMFTGDSIFPGSIGNTEYYNCDEQLLISNLKRLFNDLPDHYVIIPGHQSCTSIENERKYNMFLR